MVRRVAILQRLVFLISPGSKLVREGDLEAVHLSHDTVHDRKLVHVLGQEALHS